AASGALAMLSSDERVCAGLVALQAKRGTLLRILKRLLVEEDEDEEEEEEENEERGGGTVSKAQGGKNENKKDESGEPPIADFDLVHRGIVILRNLAVLVVEKRTRGVKEFVGSLAREGIVGVVERVVKEGMRRQKEEQQQQQQGGRGGPKRSAGGVGGSSSSSSTTSTIRPVLENALEFVIALRNASDLLG
ncbi:hypothetical protein FRC17_002880, partial [Serendipita sp. 399]